MVKRMPDSEESSYRPRPPGKTPEDRENQLIAAAVDLAEQQIRNGNVSSQVLTHYLKLGSSREKLEQLKMQQEVELMAKKREIMESEKRVEAMYAEAMDAFRAYSGQARPDEEYNED